VWEDAFKWASLSWQQTGKRADGCTTNQENDSWFKKDLGGGNKLKTVQILLPPFCETFVSLVLRKEDFQDVVIVIIPCFRRRLLCSVSFWTLGGRLQPLSHCVISIDLCFGQLYPHSHLLTRLIASQVAHACDRRGSPTCLHICWGACPESPTLILIQE